MRVQEVMNVFVVRAHPNSSVKDVAVAMRDQGVGLVCVCDENHVPLGVVTDRDITTRLCAKGLSPEDTPVGDIMSEKPVTCELGAKVEEIHQLMNENNIARVLVVDGEQKIAGIITLAELWHYESPLTAGSVSRRVTERELRLHAHGVAVAIDERQPS
jgi:CBS domain-containing protein